MGLRGFAHGLRAPRSRRRALFRAQRSADRAAHPGSWGAGCLTGKDHAVMMERIWRTLGGLVLLAAGIGIAWYHGPLLIRDFGIGDNVELATQAKLVGGRCQSRAVVIYYCDLNIE